MQIASLTFIFFILPFSLVLCRLASARMRAYLLLFLSALLYWSVEGWNIALPAAVIVFDYVMVRLLGKCRAFPSLRRGVMICSVVKSVGLIVLYSILSQVYGVHYPFGLGVFCLTSAGYVIDCYQDIVSGEASAVNVALITAFFPQLYAGPLVSANKLLPQMKSMRMSLYKFGSGAELFVQGLAKKIIIGDVIYALYAQIKGMPSYNLTTLAVWMMVVTLALSTYFTLSGYCDMAKGIGLMFGFELPNNFDYPYISVSINDFFARFNVTINKYIRRYVYFNLGGAQGSVISGIFNIFFVTILMGLWFGIRLNVLIWGAYFALFVILERYVLRSFMEAIPTLFRWLYSMAVILVSFVILAGNTPQMSLEYFKFMFGIGKTVILDGGTIYMLSSNFLVLLLAVVCATNAAKLVSDFFTHHIPLVWSVISAVLHGILLIVTISFML